MANKDWKTFMVPYEQAVEEIKIKIKSIRKEYRRNNEYSPVEFVTGRVKEVSSILEKARKFGIPADRVGYELEDIAGIRIMCQFVDDIYTVVDILRSRRDMTILYEKDYVDNVKASGYRSYHIIIKYQVNLASGPKDIIAEFQIRTLAMNFWATVEHSLNYKYKPSIKYSIELYKYNQEYFGALKIQFRTQSETLIHTLSTFFEIWVELEAKNLKPLIGNTKIIYTIDINKFERSLIKPHPLTDNKMLSESVGKYIDTDGKELTEQDH